MTRDDVLTDQDEILREVVRARIQADPDFHCRACGALLSAEKLGNRGVYCNDGCRKRAERARRRGVRS